MENAVLRLDKESRSVFSQHEAAISELREALKEAAIYKWIARAAVLLLFGSAVGFFWKFNTFVDNRISRRVVKSDRLALALSQAQFGRFRDALAILDEVRLDAEQGKTSVDDEFREFLYDNMIWVLAGIEDVNPDGSWVGKEQYDALIKDSKFINMMIRSGTRDPLRSESIAICILKYDEGVKAADRAQAYLNHALARMEGDHRKADVHWKLAMLYLTTGATDQAKIHLIQASSLHPNFYHVQDMSKYENSFLHSTEFQMWDRIARRVSRTELATDYRKVAQELSAAQ